VDFLNAALSDRLGALATATAPLALWPDGDDERETVNVRCGFTASEGFQLVAADYCQVELRILAHFSGDQVLCCAFRSGADPFILIAARWCGSETAAVTAEQRSRVKQICYALIYGAGPALVAEQAGISEDEAAAITFLAGVKDQCRRQGYVETLLGRRRYLPNIRSEDPQLRSRAERQAVNTLIQGSAADLIKLAMINIHCKLAQLSREREHASPLFFRRPRSNPGAGLYRLLDDVRPVLQVHDELLFEARRADAPALAAIVRECMQSAVVLRWGALRPLESESAPILEPAPQPGDSLASEGGHSESLFSKVVGAFYAPNASDRPVHSEGRGDGLPAGAGATGAGGHTSAPPIVRALFGRD